MMTFEFPCRLKIFFAFVAILLMHYVRSCPVNITALCQCSAFNNGLYISCSNISFIELIAALKSEIKAPINVLIVRDSEILELNSGIFSDLTIESLEISNCSLGSVADDALE